MTLRKWLDTDAFMYKYDEMIVNDKNGKPCLFWYGDTDEKYSAKVINSECIDYTMVITIDYKEGLR